MQVINFFWRLEEGVAGVVAGTFADHNLLSYYLFISLSSHRWFTLVFWQPPYLEHDKFNLNRYGTGTRPISLSEQMESGGVSVIYKYVSAALFSVKQ